jgi:hypothetical protein
LQIKVLLVTHDALLVVGLGGLRCAFDLVNDHSVLVDRGTKEQIGCLLFNQEVSVCADLVEAQRGANPENGFPGV